MPVLTPSRVLRCALWTAPDLPALALDQLYVGAALLSYGACTFTPPLYPSIFRAIDRGFGFNPKTVTVLAVVTLAPNLPRAPHLCNALHITCARSPL